MLVFVVATDAKGDALRYFKLREDLFLNPLSELAQRGFVWGYRYFYVTLTTLTFDGRRRPIFAYGTNLREFDGGTCRSRNSEVLNLLNGVAVVFFQTADDIKLRAIFLEVTASHTVYAVAQVGSDGSRSETQARSFLFVNNNIDFRTLVVARDGSITCSLYAVVTDILNLLCERTRFIKVITEDLDFYRVASSTTARGADVEVSDFGISAELLTENLSNLKNRTLAVIFLRETDGHADGIVHRRGEECTYAIVIVGAGRGRDKLNLRSKQSKTFLESTSRLEGLLNAGTTLEFNFYGHTAVILLLHEVRTNSAREYWDKGQNEEQKEDAEGSHFIAQAPTQDLSILAVEPVEETHYRTVVPRLVVLIIINQITFFIYVHLTRFENLRAEHRGERDSDDGRSTANDGNDPAELLKHDTSHTGKHCKRHEYSHEHKRSSDYGYPYLIRSIDSCLARILAAIHMLGDILEHHDSIVHHHTDSDIERTERDDVERAACNSQVDKCHHEGDRNGEAHDKCCTPATQEEEHYEDHKQKCVTNGFLQRIDGVLDVFRRVVDNLQLHVSGERFLQFSHFLAHIFTDLHCVAATLLRYDDSSTVFAVGLLIERELLDGILYGSDIAEENLTAFAGGRNYDIIDVIRRLIFGAHLHLILLFLELHRT